jgi:chemosensory pili system protein ChpA (sensor histidine kinase/response regulator)
MELHRPIGESPIALAHSLAGSLGDRRFADLSHLARSLEHAQMRARRRSATARPTRPAVLRRRR